MRSILNPLSSDELAGLASTADLLAVLDFNWPVPYSLTPKAYAVLEEPEDV